MSEPIRAGQAYPAAPLRHPAVRRPQAPAETPFSRVLRESLQTDRQQSLPARLAFSQHAMMRLAERGIRLTDADLARLEEGVAKAAAKGAKESLVLMNNVAFVVSVTNRTVITAVDTDHMRDNVFTQIDSAVVL